MDIIDVKVNPVKHWVIDIYKNGVVCSQQGYRGREAGVAKLANDIMRMTGCQTRYRLR